MKIINFDASKFNSLKDKKWMLGNNILYKMCLDHPGHKDPEEIRAKIWLIGRAYAASIERRSKKEKINDDFYDHVVNEFIKFNSKNKFDEKLNKIKNKEFNNETLKDILVLHYELTKFFKELTGKGKRSLASKYLHFHVQVFPIYDSRANDSLSKIVKGKIGDATFECDRSYYKFCTKLLYLFDEIKNKTGKSPTLREIDTFLIKIANDRLNKSYSYKK